MIDVSVFAQEMAVLLERFEKKFSDPVLKRYYEILSKELNTEEFVYASMLSFKEDIFFPPPQSLIDRGKASGKGTQAQIVQLLKAMRMNASLPDAWQQKTGKIFLAELDTQEADAYLNYLKVRASHELPSANI